MFTHKQYKENLIKYKLNNYISEIDKENSVIFCYNIYPHDDNLWNNFYLRQARGISFHKETGKLLSLPYHKFFNINEVDETKEHKLLNECKEIIAFDKIDGSLIIIELDDSNNLICRTKRSYNNQQAQIANLILKDKTSKFKQFLIDCINSNYTPLFELVSSNPQLRVVVRYDENDLYFLALRNNKTGHYYIDIDNICKKYGIKTPNKIIFKNNNDLIKYKEELENEENIEGFVGICKEEEIFFKYKTNWYLQRHRAKDLLKAPKQFVELFLDGKLDDIYSILNEHDKKIAQQYESYCFETYNKILNEIDEIFKKDGSLQQKDFAVKYKSHPLFGLLMCKYHRKRLDIKKYFMKHEYVKIKEKIKKEIL